jgi:hypothetical protein
MRKTIEILLIILTVLLFLTAFISCKRNEAQAQAAAAQRLSNSFTCVAQVVLDGKSYTVKLSKASPGMYTMSFTKPPELAPLSFELGSDGLKVKYGIIEAPVDPASIPQSAVFNALLGAFDSAAGKSGVHAVIKGQTILINGDTQAGAFTLALGNDFTPKELDMSALKMKVTFSGFKYL